MKNNIKYASETLKNFFARNRINWFQFYKSEKKIISEINLGRRSTVLDIGCGCGGLGLALKEQFGVVNYSGVDIHESAINEARNMNNEAIFYCGDILELSGTELKGKTYDAVFSLSCVDWNVQFSEMLEAVWTHVEKGGDMVATFRLTADDGCRDFEKSYQFINFENHLTGERAAYVVLNINELLCILRAFNPCAINAYGYWGKPSATAITPYEKLCFSAFSVTKGRQENDEIFMNLELPEDILSEVRDFSIKT